MKMEIDKHKYSLWTWKHPFMLHWIVNPGLAFNELVLGQRVPKVTLVEKDSRKPLQERTHIPCPHCGTIHPGVKWSLQNNAFKNWFGLYCDQCGKTIPCLTNLTSAFILAVTFPLWFWFKNSLKKQWLSRQAKRYQNINMDTADPLEGYGWIKTGLGWGATMFILMSVLFPLIWGDALSAMRLLIEAVIWTLGGILFGYTLKLINGKKMNATESA